MSWACISFCHRSGSHPFPLCIPHPFGLEMLTLSCRLDCCTDSCVRGFPTVQASWLWLRWSTLPLHCTRLNRQGSTCSIKFDQRLPCVKLRAAVSKEPGRCTCKLSASCCRQHTIRWGRPCCSDSECNQAWGGFDWGGFFGTLALSWCELVVKPGLAIRTIFRKRPESVRTPGI